MRLPRISTRRLLILVAGLAVVFGLLVALQRRRERLLRLAAEYASAINAVYSGDSREHQDMLYYHDGLASKYQAAAFRPWLPVWADPPSTEAVRAFWIGHAAVKNAYPGVALQDYVAQVTVFHRVARSGGPGRSNRLRHPLPPPRRPIRHERDRGRPRGNLPPHRRTAPRAAESSIRLILQFPTRRAPPMPRIPIDDLDDPRLAIYRHLKATNETRGGDTFIVEGEKLVHRLLSSRFPTDSVLVTDRYEGHHAPVVPDDVPMFVIPHGRIETLVGYHFHRGVLACGHRRGWPDLDSTLQAAGAAIDADRLPDARQAGQPGGDSPDQRRLRGRRRPDRHELPRPAGPPGGPRLDGLGVGVAGLRRDRPARRRRSPPG